MPEPSSSDSEGDTQPETQRSFQRQQGQGLELQPPPNSKASKRNTIRENAMDRQRRLLQIIMHIASVQGYNNQCNIKDRSGNFVEGSDIVPLILYAVSKEKLVKDIEPFVNLLVDAKVPPEIITNEVLRQRVISTRRHSSAPTAQPAYNTQNEPESSDDESSNDISEASPQKDILEVTPRANSNKRTSTSLNYTEPKDTNLNKRVRSNPHSYEPIQTRSMKRRRDDDESDDEPPTKNLKRTQAGDGISYETVSDSEYPEDTESEDDSEADSEYPEDTESEDETESESDSQVESETSNESESEEESENEDTSDEDSESEESESEESHESESEDATTEESDSGYETGSEDDSDDESELQEESETD